MSVAMLVGGRAQQWAGAYFSDPSPEAVRHLTGAGGHWAASMQHASHGVIALRVCVDGTYGFLGRRVHP